MGGSSDPQGVRASVQQGDSEHQAEQPSWDLDKRVGNGVGSLAGEENKPGPPRWARGSVGGGNHGRKGKEGVPNAAVGS